MREPFLHFIRQENMTIIISSHILSEIEQLVDTIGFMKNGELVQEISNEEFEKLNIGNLEDYFWDDFFGIWKSMCIVAMFNLFLTSMFMVGVPVMVTQILGLSSQPYGFAQGALMAGRVIGGLLVGVFFIYDDFHGIQCANAGFYPARDPGAFNW